MRQPNVGISTSVHNEERFLQFHWDRHRLCGICRHYLYFARIMPETVMITDHP